MSYSEQLDAIAEHTADSTGMLLAALDAGEIDADTFLELASVLVLLGAAQGYRLAQLSLTAQLVRLGVPDPFPSRLPELDAAAREPAIRRQLRAALDADSPPERVRMAARSETIAGAQDGYERAIPRARGAITGWTRGLNYGACELCTWWSRNGRKYPADHTMPTHKGCLCAPVLVAGGPAARPVSQ